MIIDYEKFVQESLIFVVKKAFLFVKKNGFVGKHHFYISFKTKFKGVVLSKDLIDMYPDEMTINIQKDYYDLNVDEQSFSLKLNFQGLYETILVPFDAITSFADPSVKFGLQFNPIENDEEGEMEEFLVEKEVEKSANVISFDKFKKKPE